MSKPLVYVETTIPSAYYTDRRDAAMTANRELTRLWWKSATSSCELVTSPAVLRELANGTSRHVAARMSLLNGLLVLEITPAVQETAATYVHHRIMPAHPFEDALHLALASHHACDVLATWDFRHLANPAKFNFIRRINAGRDLPMPRITSPADLLGGHYG